MLNFPKWLMICLLIMLHYVQYCRADTTLTEKTVQQFVLQAGNTENDTACVRILKQLSAASGIQPKIKADTDKMIAEIERWLNDKKLSYFSSPIRKNGYYDFRFF